MTPVACQSQLSSRSTKTSVSFQPTSATATTSILLSTFICSRYRKILIALYIPQSFKERRLPTRLRNGMFSAAVYLLSDSLPPQSHGLRRILLTPYPLQAPPPQSGTLMDRVLKLAQTLQQVLPKDSRFPWRTCTDDRLQVCLVLWTRNPTPLLYSLWSTLLEPLFAKNRQLTPAPIALLYHFQLL